jgi:hypothetical protein
LLEPIPRRSNACCDPPNSEAKSKNGIPNEQQNSTTEAIMSPPNVLAFLVSITAIADLMRTELAAAKINVYPMTDTNDKSKKAEFATSGIESAPISDNQENSD